MLERGAELAGLSALGGRLGPGRHIPPAIRPRHHLFASRHKNKEISNELLGILRLSAKCCTHGIPVSPHTSPTRLVAAMCGIVFLQAASAEAPTTNGVVVGGRAFGGTKFRCGWEGRALTMRFVVV